MLTKIRLALKRSACLFRIAHGHWPTRVRMNGWNIEEMQRGLDPRDMEKLKSELEIVDHRGHDFQTADADGNTCNTNGEATRSTGEAFRVHPHRDDPSRPHPEESTLVETLWEAEVLFDEWIPYFY